MGKKGDVEIQLKNGRYVSVESLRGSIRNIKGHGQNAAPLQTNPNNMGQEAFGGALQQYKRGGYIKSLLSLSDNPERDAPVLHNMNYEDLEAFHKHCHGGKM
jgi:hypothetical protein